MYIVALNFSHNSIIFLSLRYLLLFAAIVKSWNCIWCTLSMNKILLLTIITSSQVLRFAERCSCPFQWPWANMQVKWIFTTSRTRGQRSSKTCGLYIRTEYYIYLNSLICFNVLAWTQHPLHDDCSKTAGNHWFHGTTIWLTRHRSIEIIQFNTTICVMYADNRGPQLNTNQIVCTWMMISLCILIGAGRWWLSWVCQSPRASPSKGGQKRLRLHRHGCWYDSTWRAIIDYILISGIMEYSSFRIIYPILSLPYLYIPC